MSKFPYLYRNSFKEAERYGELGKWRSSHQENITCRKDIEAAVSANFDGERLAEGCAESILYRHGFKRVRYVLTNTIHGRHCASQIDNGPLNWYRQLYVSYDRKYGPEFVVQSPPAALNQFAGQIYQAYQALGLFGPEHCIDEGNGLDYTGRVLVLSPDTLREECWGPRDQLWYAHDGSGTSPYSIGCSIRATCLGNGEMTRWDRTGFTGILDDQYLPDWAREKLEELWAPKQGGPSMGGMK